MTRQSHLSYENLWSLNHIEIRDYVMKYYNITDLDDFDAYSDEEIEIAIQKYVREHKLVDDNHGFMVCYDYINGFCPSTPKYILDLDYAEIFVLP